MIKIHHVKSKGDLKIYVSFPNDLYKGNPYYKSHMIALGFEKDNDWVECQLRLDNKKSERLKRISAYISKNSTFKWLVA